MEWLGDVMDWISESVSQTWISTVGIVTSDAARLILDIVFDWLFTRIYEGISDVFTTIDESSANLFGLAWVAAFISLFHHIGWILFVCGLIIAVFDTAIGYENGQANIKGTCLNALKGFFACSLITVVPQRLYSFCVSLQHTFASDLISSLVANRNVSLMNSGLEAIEALRTDVSVSSLLFMIMIGFCTIKIVFANIKRGGCPLSLTELNNFYVTRGHIVLGFRYLASCLCECSVLCRSQYRHWLVH